MEVDACLSFLTSFQVKCCFHNKRHLKDLVTNRVKQSVIKAEQIVEVIMAYCSLYTKRLN